jgi:hypothetical protein
MYKETLFKNYDEAVKAGNELRMTPNHFVIPDLVNQLVQITHEKIQNIHNNLKLYETFIDAYYDKIKKNDN